MDVVFVNQLAVYQYLALCRSVKTANQLNKGGFTSTVNANKGKAFSCLQGKVDALQSIVLSAIVLVPNVTQFDCNCSRRQFASLTVIEFVGIIIELTVICNLIGSLVQFCYISNYTMKKSRNTTNDTKIEYEITSRKISREKHTDKHRICNSVLDQCHKACKDRCPKSAQTAAFVPHNNMGAIIAHHFIEPFLKPVKLNVLCYL